MIYQTAVRPTMLYGCETWPVSVKDEKRTATTEMTMVRWAMGVNLLERRDLGGSKGGNDNWWSREGE